MRQVFLNLGLCCLLLSVPFLLNGCPAAGLLGLGGGNIPIFPRSSMSQEKEAPAGPKPVLKRISFEADDNMNNNSALEIHLITVYDMNVLSLLMRQPADDYFANVRQFRRDHTQIAKIISWQIVPRQQLLDQKVELGGGKPVGLVIFANYEAPGQHRVRIGSAKEIKLHLKKDGFDVTSMKD